MIKKILLFILLPFLSWSALAQPANKSVKLPPLKNATSIWVDSIYESLTLDQKIGQLFMIAAYSGGEKYNQSFIQDLIKKNNIGGLIFMQGTPEAQAEQTNTFQKMSKVPLLIGMDAEWGLGMRLKGVDDMPRQIMMGAMADSSLVYKMAQAVAYQCRRMGVHINFAPVVDINNNPNNPVINFRSFGEDKYLVSKYATQYVKGLQDQSIIASAKHFPGHGNTDVDSHLDLPVINSSAAAIDNLELYPFKQMINVGVGSIMIAHLQIPSLDNRPNTPTTLSEKVVTDLLKNKLSYKGLIITDALNMEGVAKHYAPGEVDLKAFLAGNDVLLFSQNVPVAVSKIKSALQNGTLSMTRLEESVKKILLSKYLVGLNIPKTISPEQATADLNEYTSAIRTQVASNAITLLNDSYNLMDKIKTNKANRKVYIGFGANAPNAFSKSLALQGFTEQYYVDSGNVNNIIKKIKDYDAIVIGLHNIGLYPKNSFSIPSSNIKTIQNLVGGNNTLLVHFGNPYALKYFCNSKATILCYDDKKETQTVAADMVTGLNKCLGKLPVTVCDVFKQGAGIVSLYNSLGVLNRQYADRKFEDRTVFDRNKSDGPTMANAQIDRASKINNSANPFEVANVAEKIDVPVSITCCVNPVTVGADLSKLNKIDDLMESAIARRAFPGCRVLIAKDGSVFYDKSFGNTDYESNTRVTDNTLYDIASVTKVAATTLAVMKLYDQGKISLDATLGDYLKIVRGSDKQFLKIKDVLLHQAGLKSWIPFYKSTLDSNKMLRPDIYGRSSSSLNSIKVANGVFMNKNWVDTMWQQIINSPLGARSYEYSDLDFIFLQKVVEKITGQGLDVYMTKEFYTPLGLKNTMYNPLRHEVKLNRIAPTENDDYFRYQKVHGYVHDMGAAMFGGVSGHAGLFSTASDLSVIMQMLLNGGIYNGKRYISEATVNKFTSYGSSRSRRGLGWDKPEQQAAVSSPAADNCSLNTFGHQGFTGTCVWSDPTHNITFIFLSNRTYPSAEATTFRKMEIRTKAQQYAYEALGIAKRR